MIASKCFRTPLITSLVLLLFTSLTARSTDFWQSPSRLLTGKVTNEKNATLADLSWREIGLMVPLLILMVYMGVFPKPFIRRAEAKEPDARLRNKLH